METLVCLIFAANCLIYPALQNTSFSSITVGFSKIVSEGS